MRRLRFRLRLLLGLGLALPLALVHIPWAQAAWSSGGAGTASALADTMPAGNQPVAAVSGTTVTLQWSAALFPGGQGTAGYLIRRFDAATGTEGTVGAGCSGTVTATTCTELNVPAGSWTYTDTPVQDNWTGGQSASSAAITVS